MGLKSGGLQAGGVRNLSEIVDIPDSVVSRIDDDTDSSTSEKFGLYFSTTNEWSEMDFQVSNNTLAFTKIYIIDDSDGTTVTTKTVSNIQSGDVITVSFDSPIQGDYRVVADAEGSSFTLGLIYLPDRSASYPFESSDGNLSLTAGYDGGSKTTNYCYVFTKIGNISS
jgi:hypothetical protein